ncbi:MAG: alpha/beta fold hydrolase [Actinomycetota bacterium]|nr:alpha/beta fold hydrolase [Actinomycetota bacterium]
MTTTESNKKTVDRPAWLPEDAWPFQVRTIHIDNHPIAYTDEGEGPVLLLVHDGMWSYIWSQLIERLRGDFRVVTLDFPGSGLSPDSGQTTSIAGDSRLLEAFVDQLGLEDMTLALHDLGGSVGIGFAARRPELIKAMVMVNTFAWRLHTTSLKTMFAIMTSGPITALNVSTNLIPRLTSTKSGIGLHLDQQARAAFLGGFSEKGQRRRFHDLMTSAKTETDYLAELEVAYEATLADKPVLTIYGERNDPFGFQARFRELYPESEEMVIPKGNHFPMSDDPDGVAARITDWYARNVSQGRTTKAHP